MSKIPDVVIIIGQNKELNAMKECRKIQIKTIALIDTNCDPTLCNYPIPSNDDSISSVSLILSELSNSLL